MSETKKNQKSEDTSTKDTKKDPKETWASDSQDELEDWIEEQGIQLRY